jgi:hypothetical protein
MTYFRSRLHQWRGVSAGLLVIVLAGPLAEGAAGADDDSLIRITFSVADDNTHTVEGRIVVEARDGGLLLLARNGTLWNITPDKLLKREATGKTFEPMSTDEISQQLRREFGEDFEIVKTRHYVICSNAGKAYARWCGMLFERLMSSFRTHWRSRPLRLHDPKLPLTAVVFANAEQFARFAADDAGPEAAGAKGYYSVRTNRIVLYDLTAGPNSRPAKTAREVNRKIAAAPVHVATVVHEATHQIAFNCGMHTRYADNPLWLSEGMAMYFETPDLRSRTGWRTVGKVNRGRLARFRDYLGNRRKADSLVSQLASNDRFAAAKTTEDAYAEAWALTYFLIKTRRKQFLVYLNRVAKKTAFVWDEPETRLDDFRAAFGSDLKKLDRQFLKYVERLR